MNRRGFLKGIGLVIGGVALEQAVPLGRVWSFPAKIVPLNSGISRTYTSGADAFCVEDIRRAKAMLTGENVKPFDPKANLPLLYQCAHNKVVVDQLASEGYRVDLRTVETVIRREYRILS